jgi:predicted nuclease with TOPRIM domain
MTTDQELEDRIKKVEEEQIRLEEQLRALTNLLFLQLNSKLNQQTETK